MIQYYWNFLIFFLLWYFGWTLNFFTKQINILVIISVLLSVDWEFILIVGGVKIVLNSRFRYVTIYTRLGNHNTKHEWNNTIDHIRIKRHISGSSLRWEKLTSGYFNYPLKRLDLRYMYCSQKHFSE